MSTMLLLFVTYRPLLSALVALARAAIAATSRTSDGGRIITVEERPLLNRAFWTAYDTATARDSRRRAAK